MIWPRRLPVPCRNGPSFLPPLLPRGGTAAASICPTLGPILAFQASGAGLPVDCEHQDDKAEAKFNGPVPAAGWIEERRAADSGIRVRAEWTATLHEMTGWKEYRHLSPSFLFHPGLRQIVRLKGAGLVHNPNLCLTGPASQEDRRITAPADKTAGPVPLIPQGSGRRRPIFPARRPRPDLQAFWRL